MYLLMLEKEYRAQCAKGRRSGVCFIASSLLTLRRRLADARRIEPPKGRSEKLNLIAAFFKIAPTLNYCWSFIEDEANG